METYCAKIEDGVVTQVIVCDCDRWAKENLGGDWVCSGTTLVGVGWSWSEEGGFVPPPVPEDPVEPPDGPESE